MSSRGVTLGDGEEEGTYLGGHAPSSGRVWSETPTRRHAGTPARMLLRAHRVAARVAVGAAARRLGAPAGDAVTQQAAQTGRWGTRGHASLKLGPRHRASVSARTVKLTLTPALSAASLVWLRRHRQARPRPSPPRRAVARSGTPPRVWPLRTHAGVSSESLTRRHAGMLKKLD